MFERVKRVQRAMGWAVGLGLVVATGCGEGEETAGGDGGAQSAGGDGGAQSKSAPTWHQDIAPLVAEKCGQCHEEGGIAPFSLESYAEAKNWAEPMAQAVEAGRMPPFLAKDTDECQPRLGWKNDLRLSEAEKQLLRDWADNGAPQGDADEAAEIPTPAPVTLEREDVKLAIPEPITVEGVEDIHTCVVLDPALEQDTYVTARLMHSGNTRVLHHVVSYLVPPGENEDGTPRTKAELEQLIKDEKGVGIGGRYDCFGGPSLDGLQAQILDAWAPGGLPNRAPENSGQPMPKGSLVLLDMHYHPTGAGPETDDSSYLALTTTDDPPTYVSRTILLGNFSQAERDYGVGVGRLLKQSGEDEPEFIIPAGAEEHVEEMTWTWNLSEQADIRVFGAGTHMHYVGYDMLVTLENTEPADGEPEEECLVQTPAWDFNWQRGYAYDGNMEDLPSMKKGDVLRMRCKFNNTTSNRFVREALADEGLDAPVDVPLGEDTLDEMCLATLGIMYLNVPE